MIAYEVEPYADAVSGVCECCGNVSRQITGFVHENDVTILGYSFNWTVGRFPDHPANIDLVMGEWGDVASPEQRFLISMLLTVRDHRPEVLVIDSGNRPMAYKSDLVSRALRRDQVVGTPLATKVFALIDAIFLDDPRVSELLADGPRDQVR
jgi:hypothetical protein